MSTAEAIAPEQSVDEVRQSLSVTDKGKTANTIDNCRIVFCCDPLLRDAIRLNLLTDRVDIVQDLGWRRNTSALTDTDVKYLLLYFERNYELTSEKKITAALSIVANENCYHPIQDVLNSLVWDGTPRIRSCLHHFLGADESDYVEEMLKHFLLGAIRRVFRPGSKYEEMLTMNEKDKNEMLEAILNENESYQCKLWAVIMAGADTYALIGGLSTLTGGAAAALGALSNAYCYLGVTEQHLNMVIVNSVNVSKIENRLSLPLSSITKAEVKGGLLPGRKVVMLHFGKEKMKISLMNNAIGSDIQGQKENVEMFCQIVSKLG